MNNVSAEPEFLIEPTWASQHLAQPQTAPAALHQQSAPPGRDQESKEATQRSHLGWPLFS